MRENRPYGSEEGGEARAFPTPIGKAGINAAWYQTVNS
jgi:hypothetical protein